jgi:hypothetical protein
MKKHLLHQRFLAFFLIGTSIASAQRIVRRTNVVRDGNRQTFHNKDLIIEVDRTTAIRDRSERLITISSFTVTSNWTSLGHLASRSEREYGYTRTDP